MLSFLGLSVLKTHISNAEQCCAKTGFNEKIMLSHVVFLAYSKYSNILKISLNQKYNLSIDDFDLQAL